MDDIRRQFQENTFGTIAFTQPFIAHFRVRRSGHIINITSVGTHINYGSMGAYSASKSALDSFSQSLAREVAPFGVRVHIIEPGYFPTSIFTSHPNYTPGGASTDLKDVPIAPGLSKIYTEFSQGYNLVNLAPRINQAKGHAGDVDLLAERIYEIATDTGMARELGVTRQPMLRVPMGSDSGEAILGSLTAAVEDCRALEPVWRSTDKKMVNV